MHNGNDNTTRFIHGNLTVRNMKKAIIQVRGTHCTACKALIEDVCKDIAGVMSCTVDFKTGKTVIEHDGKLDLALVKKEIESLGKYEVKL